MVISDGPAASRHQEPWGHAREAETTISGLIEELQALRAAVLSDAAPLLEGLGGIDPPSVENLAHCLALRHHDLRALQRRLMALGLSSLGWLESRVLPTLEAVLAARAECVMFNKGPEISEAVAMLDRLLARMDLNMFKKTPTLRAQKSW